MIIQKQRFARKHQMNKQKKSVIALIVAIIGSLFGALSGADNSSKIFRRFLIALMLLIIGVLFKNYASILIALYIPIFHIGYGIPCHNDAGSLLGRFFYNLFKKDELLADIFTKLTITILFSLVLTLIAILNSNLMLLCITIPITIASHVIFGAFVQSLGMTKMFNRSLNNVEIARYFLLTLAAIIQIIY